jgi:NitT/TauT family transport system substrate-binding protein
MLQPRSTFLVAASAFALNTAMADAQAVTQLHIGTPLTDEVTPLLYAESSGLLQKQGLNVLHDKVGSGNAVAAGIIGGAYEIGLGSSVPVITGHAKGVPLVFCAAAGIYQAPEQNTPLIVRADAPFRTAADLNGKVLAVSAIGDLYWMIVKNWIGKNGGDVASLKFVEMPASAVPAALDAGRVDGAGLVGPALSQAMGSGKVRVLAYLDRAIADRFILTGWFCTTDYAAKNRPTLDKFRSAIRDASIYANAHHAETIDILAKFSGMDPAVIASGRRATYATVLDPKLIQPMIDLCAKNKVIPEAFDAREIMDPALR